METQIEKSNSEYRQWLTDLKSKIRQSQIKASIRVNEELLRLYWSMGQDFVVRQMETTWGSKFFDKLSKDLHSEFPNMKGFSRRNLYRIKQFYLFYTQDDLIRQQVTGVIVPQLVAQLQTADNKKNTIMPQVVAQLEIHPIFQIPWGHHTEIFARCETVQDALFYVRQTIENGWSRSTLIKYITSELHTKQGKAITNFSRLLPEVHSDLAKDITKNPYSFDFLTLADDHKERELETGLTENITKTLLELGKGFSFVGRQVAVQAGSKELFIDMLFYHLKLRCYVVVELKACEFEPAFTGQLGAYVSAVNHQMRGEFDNPTLGLLICKTQDNVLAQYSLESSSHPIGISAYEFSNLIPENYKSELPTIEEIEEELKDIE
jgi:predicted nuclease of restriction endonuclease-like (RecB) superfamily